MPSNPRSRPVAERLFARFLERREAGERLSFAAWVQDHPDAAGELAQLHQRWLELNRRLGSWGDHGEPDGRAVADAGAD